MQLSTRTEKDATIITVEAERIDAAVAIRFKDLMRDTAEGCTGRIILDLGQVDFIDSSGLGAIVASMKQLGDGQKLELAALNANVDKVFRLTRMDTVFPIHASLGNAVNSHAN
ncbi:anti-sigma B factor antagonist [Pseudooceanicola antarcticus]|uniref:Anti-sigma factor antagonist n=1 Tax=Pseudooceanicola antarcticus TaxID=1247613 RepID=A0A285HNJ5_9RHOB|nr:STAS domain-containing protein [Pseudooceanicola antarcticus]PJE27752.1 anti-sigma factor antagonist [Pseudooceanicola antarcticus]SNY37295.1 anti-sigma B factor antagonist [Pseudooceanicola antarcticus]